MLEQIIENIIQQIRKEVVKPGMDRVPLNYLLSCNIPDSIKHFFDQEVELWIREESQKISDSDRFDYELPEVQMLLDKIFDILKQNVTFHINQFNRLLERAIKLEANYLIRPHQTLTQFLFKDSFVITTIEVYDMLKYFDKFQYYKDALTEYFNKKYLREISQTQFEELIAGIDAQVFANNPVETALQTIKIINNFINEGRETASDRMTPRILSMIFRDRNLDQFATLMEREQQEGTTEISMSELEQILRTGKTLRELRETVTPKTAIMDTLADIEEEKPAVEVESISVSEQVEMPVEETVEEFEEEEEEEEIPVTTQTATTTVEEKLSAAEQLANVVGEKMKGDHLEDLHNLIRPKQRKKFIKKIFSKNEQQYMEFIGILNQTPSWKNASILIDSYFYQNGVNPYSKEALEFSDLVYNRYYPKDISINKGEEFK
ncbi:MAG: hypothetical protein D6748_00585 [Calditrichaeota bacterium]|nr:MAG: hypothetical protein D6748_00585 [Calditrichota bacterium]